MKRLWEEDELVDVWTLRPDEIENINDAYPGTNKFLTPGRVRLAIPFPLKGKGLGNEN